MSRRIRADSAEQGLGGRSVRDVEEADERLVADLVQRDLERVASVGEALQRGEDGRKNCIDRNCATPPRG